MSQGFGGEVPAPHNQATHREVTKYLVVLPNPEGTIAKLFLGNFEQVAEFDANTDEVTSLIKGIAPSFDATGKEWDSSFSYLSNRERAAASVYTLNV